MSNSDQTLLKQMIIEERTLMALHDLSLSGQPIDSFMAEVLNRLCKAQTVPHLLPAGCYFKRDFVLDNEKFVLASQHALPPALAEFFIDREFSDRRFNEVMQQRNIKLATRFETPYPSAIQGHTIKGVFYLPLGSDEDSFGVILLFLGDSYKPEPNVIKFLQRAMRAIARGLAQRKAQEKWVRAYQDLELKHVHQLNQINRLSQELALPANAMVAISEQVAKQNLPAIRDPAQLLKNSALHLRTVSNKLSKYLAHGSKHMDANPAVFSFSETVICFLREVRGLIESRGIRFSFHVDSSIPAQLIGDREKIIEIISILTDNAIKFTQAGEISIAIDLARQTDSNLEIEFSVQDTGIGIRDSDQKTLFVDGGHAHLEHASRMPSIRHGLRLAHRYVALLEGSIDLSSRPGVGSKFTFTLPLKKHASSSLRNSVESTLTMEAITVLPTNLISETERIKEEHHDLLKALVGNLHQKLSDFDIASEQAVEELIPVLKNTVYRQDLKSIKTAIGQYNFETAADHLRDLARALNVKLDES